MHPQKMKQVLPSESPMLFDEISNCLGDWAKTIPKPHHLDLVEEWKNTMKDYISTSYPEDDAAVESITAGLLEAYTAWTAESNTYDIPVDHDQTHALMLRPQTTQRTTDWYVEFQRCLTASELYKIFGSPRERGTLILQKAGKIEISGRGQKLVCYKEKMAPFDWGICFEPVVKQILEFEWEAMIHECGRFVHLVDTRLAASPDGLILRAKKYPEMAGHLLEIKCPKSRQIGLKIPMDYFYQMQLQLEVTGVRACEYVEVKFEFTENNLTVVPTDTWCGHIAVVGCFCEESGSWNPCKYEYGPVNDLSWKPNLGLNEQTLQLNTWICPKTNLHHERVLRDEGWFSTLLPKIQEFWSDVALAKEGKFTLPDSSRKKKDVVCEIMDSDTEESPIDPTIKRITIN
jgi:hypothetical protein